jgi:phosphoribosylanthranilate isomerase
MVAVKICGVKDVSDINTSIECGAKFLGFNFFRKSPRYIEPTLAGALSRKLAPVGIVKTGLFVDDDNLRIAGILADVRLDLLQLHGSETPERVAAIKAEFGVPVMKVIKVRDASDIARAAQYEGVADRLLFDAQPPADMKNALPGGNAVSFDWTLLQGFRSRLPWMLSGGLTPQNVAEAIRQSGARAVDVASGVEDRPGEKNTKKIMDFLAAARAA